MSVWRTPIPFSRRTPSCMWRGIALACVLLVTVPCGAAELYASTGLNIRWDNTLRYNSAIRIGPRESALLANVNGDDGDRNFAPGLISNRLDLLSELDVATADSGVHVSVAAWYDTVYQQRTGNNSPATYNAASVPNTQFPRATRNLLGQDAELRDAFVYSNFQVDDVAVSLRMGRQNLLWGESLFFDPNSIAAAQSPYDYIKATNTLADYLKSVFLPVNQVSLTVQPSPAVSVAFYYQLEWRASRLPGVGSYFSYLDTLGAGSERLLLGGGAYLVHGPDIKPPTDGQFGAALHARIDDLDLGFYALRYHAKYPFLTSSAGVAGPPGSVGTFALDYPAGIQLYGISFSDYLDTSNVAGEFSLRRDMPLISTSRSSSNKSYAEGDVLHGQVSSESTLSPSLLWDSASFSVELSCDYLLGATQNRAALSSSRDPFTMNVHTLFEPRIFEVMPNLDISFPLSLGYDVTGRSVTSYTQNAGAGDFEMGISATFRTVWRAEITLTTYLGSPDRQPLADRDFIAFSIERSL